MSNKQVEFEAVFPQAAKVVDFHGGGGTRIILDISEKYKPQALELPAYFFNKRLKVKIEVVD